MTSCTMVILTIFGIPIALLTSFAVFVFLKDVVRDAFERTRERLRSLILQPIRILPAAGAVTIIAAVGLGLGYGWKDAGPCGDTATAQAPAQAHATSCVVAMATDLLLD